MIETLIVLSDFLDYPADPPEAPTPPPKAVPNLQAAPMRRNRNPLVLNPN